MPRSAPLLLIAALLLAGCGGAEDPAPDAQAGGASHPATLTPPAPGAPSVAPAAPPGPRRLDAAACPTFCEPSVAVNPSGRVFALAWNSRGAELVVSEDGLAAFEPAKIPPLPEGAPPGAYLNDLMVHTAPSGRLYVSGLVTGCYPEGRCDAYAHWGVSVAASDDQGRTWPTNTFIDLRATGGGPGADRQWLAFGPDAMVCVSYVRLSPTVIHAPVTAPASLPQGPYDAMIACSKDGGKTFAAPASARGGPTEGRAFIGRPVFDEGGDLLGPIHDHEVGNLLVARSKDGGATFTTERVAPAGYYWANLVPLPGGGMVMLWVDAAGALRLASRDAAGAWGKAETLSSPGALAIGGPWLERAPGGFVAVWHEKATEGAKDAALLLARGGPGAWNVTVVDAKVPAKRGTVPDTTDFAHFVVTPSGSALIAVADAVAQRAVVLTYPS